MREQLRIRLLAALGAGSVVSAAVLACGSSDDTSSSSSSSGGGGDASHETAADATQDQANDAAPDVHFDVDPDVIPTPRRPFLVGSSLRTAPAEPRGDWMSAPDDELLAVDETTRRELAAAWTKDALEEHASVAAFSRFAMSLLAVGAPPELVEGALRAGLDEIVHARECFALARRYGAGDVGPGPLVVHDALTESTLVDLASLTAEEGCVGETLGVLAAIEQLERARDPRVKRVLERIVRDEMRHAELAWRFVAWASARDARVGEAVQRAAMRAIDATRAMPIRVPSGDPALFAAHGRLTCAEARAVSERGIQDILLPCLEALDVGVDRATASSLSSSS